MNNKVQYSEKLHQYVQNSNHIIIISFKVQKTVFKKCKVQKMLQSGNSAIIVSNENIQVNRSKKKVNVQTAEKNFIRIIYHPMWLTNLPQSLTS